ncbi:hypothetical protein [Halorubrum sp. 48-1-W]|uniref:hypothetical protein n=1 Tax=Halorubrum sp. 48-1-W TaxID=2249761 RepID=UPI000FCB0AA9|nr:hypothetical protein [Halorubrum sp. 48-1-W]
MSDKNRKTVYINDENAQFVENSVDNFSGLVNKLVSEHRRSLDMSAEEQLEEQLEELQQEMEAQRETLEEKEAEQERIQNKLENLHDEKAQRADDVVAMVAQLYQNKIKPSMWVQNMKNKALVGNPKELFNFVVDETDLLHDSGSDIYRNDIDHSEEEIEKVRDWFEAQQN